MSEIKEIKNLINDRKDNRGNMREDSRTGDYINNSIGDSFEFINKKISISSEGNDNSFNNNEGAMER